MGKIKALFRKQSIRKSFAVHLVLCVVAAFFLAVFSSAACQWGQDKIRQKYEPMRKAYEGKIVTEDVDFDISPMYYYTQDIEDYYTDSERILDKILSIMSLVVVPAWFAACIVITSVHFYGKNLKKPLAVLDAAAEEIAGQNLDFQVHYEKNDEMGRLCDTFERMRLALKENNREMWRQMEERKRLNAAFSHDMRTPLTVLKGQSEMLVKYVPEGKMTEDKIVSTAQTMRAHISRLEDYVQTMNRIQKLEDLEVRAGKVPVRDITAQLEECVHILCGEKKFILHTPENMPKFILVDRTFVMQVCENLLSNAVRYAKSQITVAVSAHKELRISFCDDGPGFSRKDLNDALKPFYQGSRNPQDGQRKPDGRQPQNDQRTPDGRQPQYGQRAPESQQAPDGGHCQSSGHFGMGLYICKVLCEKHRGSLILENGSQGAVVTAVFGFLEENRKN